MYKQDIKADYIFSAFILFSKQVYSSGFQVFNWTFLMYYYEFLDKC
jgi:hypothetical protein